MAKPETRVSDESVVVFLNGLSDEGSREDCWQLVEMMREVTGNDPRMWGTAIVGFGSYHYVYESGRKGDWPITGFSPRAKNISVEIMSGFSGHDSLMEKPGKHKTGKSWLYVKRLADIDQSVLRKLTERSVAYMHKHYECR